MKRYFCLALIAVFLISTMITPAAASEATYGIVDLLSYGYVESNIRTTANRIEVQDIGAFEVRLPSAGLTSFGQFSALVDTDCTGIEFGMNYENTFNVTVTNTVYGDNIKFIQGWFTSDLHVYDDQIAFTVNTSGGMYMTFLSFNVRPYNTASMYVPLYCFDMQYGYSYTLTGITFLDFTTGSGTANGFGRDFVQLRFNPQLTEGTYDYFDINLEINGICINSISCTQGDKALDFDVGFSYLDADGQIVLKNGTSASDVLSQSVSQYWITLRVYCDGSDFINGVPYVWLNGYIAKGQQPASVGYVRMYPCSATFEPTVLSPIEFMLQKLTNTVDGWFSEVVRLLGGETGVADEFQGEVSQQAGELENMSSALDSVKKPEISEVSGDLSSHVESSDVILAASPIQPLLENQYILSIFMISMTLMLGSYVLYGKK